LIGEISDGTHGLKAKTNVTKDTGEVAVVIETGRETDWVSKFNVVDLLGKSGMVVGKCRPGEVAGSGGTGEKRADSGEGIMDSFGVKLEENRFEEMSVGKVEELGLGMVRKVGHGEN